MKQNSKGDFVRFLEKPRLTEFYWTIKHNFQEDPQWLQTPASGDKEQSGCDTVLGSSLKD
jgi:hypothetical protein